jgi:hypothetical protein
VQVSRVFYALRPATQGYGGDTPTGLTRTAFDGPQQPLLKSDQGLLQTAG